MSQSFSLLSRCPDALPPLDSTRAARKRLMMRRSACLRWPENDGSAVMSVLRHLRLLTRSNLDGVLNVRVVVRQFSVTSNTVFHGRKKSFTDLLAAICIIMNAAKGVSALQLARDLKCQHKSAWILGHKIRVSSRFRNCQTQNYRVRSKSTACTRAASSAPPIGKENRIDRRRAPNQNRQASRCRSLYAT